MSIEVDSGSLFGFSHTRIGDPGPIWSGQTTTRTCNCACQRCMSGSCCMFPDVSDPARTTRVTTGTGVAFATTCAPIEHDYSVLDPARLFCRKCGITRTV